MKMNSLNISNKISHQLQQKLSLAPGQIIQAQVIKFEDSQVLLKLGSYLLKAKTNVPLKPGEKLKLLVESTDTSLIKLKILTANQKMNLENITLSSGCEFQVKLENIVQQLFSFNMPISQEAIIEINRLINRYKISEDKTQLIVWLKSVGIQIDSDKDIQILEALQRFFRGELSSSEETQFFKFLNASENNIFGGINILGWPIGAHYVYLLTQGPKGEGLQKECSQVIIKINSLKFEELWFKMELVGKTLNANIICNSNHYRVILAKEVSLLCKTLQAAGYQINDIPVNVSNIKTVFDLIINSYPKISKINLEI